MEQTQTAAPVGGTLSPAPAGAPQPPFKRRWWRIRFSLRTLLLGVLLAGSSYGVWFRWNPTWQVERRLGGAVSRVIYSADGTRLLTTGNDGGYLWDGATGKRLAALTTPQQRVSAAVLSPAGGRIVTVSAATPAAGAWIVHTWDVETGRELSTFACADKPQSLVLSPDGGRIATNGHNNVVRIWDAATGFELAALAGQERIRRAVCFSGDGSRLITHGGDPMQRVWDAATGKELLELKGHEGSDGWVNDAAYSPDGRLIVTASGDATARVWDAESGNVVAVLTGHGDGVKWARFSPDGGRVVTASDDCTARVWDVHSGKQVALLKGHRGAVSEASFSPDGRRVLTIATGRSAGVWDAASGRLLAMLEGRKGMTWWSAAFAPDGNHIAAVTSDWKARVWLRRRPEWWWGAAWIPETWLGLCCACALVWSLVDDRRTLGGRRDATVAGGTPAVRFPRLSLASVVLLVLAGGSAGMLVWRDHPAWVEERKLTGHTGEVRSAALSPDGRRVVTASQDGTARIWDLATGRELLVVKGHTGEVRDARFSPDGRRFVTGGADNTVRVWDVETGGEVLVLKSDHPHAMKPIKGMFAADGSRIVTIGLGFYTRIWDAATGKQLHELHSHHCPEAKGELSADGRRLVTHGCDGAKLWDVETGKELPPPGQREMHPWVTRPDLAVSPDSSRILVSGDWTGRGGDRVARLWDAATGVELLTLKGARRGEAYFNDAVFSADGSLVLTSYQGEVMLWDAQRGWKRATLPGHYTVAMAVFPDGQRVLTAGEHRVCVWDAETGRELAWLQRQEGKIVAAVASPDGKRIVVASLDRTPRVYYRRRPEYWWGVAWLPECWLTGVFATGFVWSVRRDRGALGTRRLIPSASSGCGEQGGPVPRDVAGPADKPPLSDSDTSRAGHRAG